MRVFSMMRFIKLMMILLGSLFVMAVFRTITQAIQKGFSGSTSGGGTAVAHPPPEVSTGGELKKCAACGVYNAAANSLTRVRGGATTYYCSTECRSKSAA